MIHSGAFFDCHALVFLGTASNSGVTEQEMETNYFVEEVSEWLFEQGRHPTSDVLELISCDACLFHVLRWQPLLNLVP